MYDTSTQTWTDLTSATSGIPPTARQSHGFAALDGKLYVFGGLDESGSPVQLPRVKRISDPHTHARTDVNNDDNNQRVVRRGELTYS